jgi:tetratricopeptide (TPR) repeat protein
VIAWLRTRLAATLLTAARHAEARANATAPFDGRGAALQPALRVYRLALAVAPRRSTPWREAAFRLGSLLAGENSVRDPAAAVPLLEAVGTAEACYFLGEAYALQERFDEAEAAWRRGLALDPSHPGIVDVLARLPADRASAARRRRRPGL